MTVPDPITEPTDAEMAEAEANLQAAAEHRFALSKARFTSHIDGVASGLAIGVGGARFFSRFAWWPWMAMASTVFCFVVWIAVLWVRRPK